MTFRRAALLVFLLVVAAPSVSAAPSKKGRSADVGEVLELYRAFEYEKALEKIASIDHAGGNNAVELAVLEGILCAELNKRPRAIRAFKRALVINPGAELPFPVAPKVSNLFRAAQEESRSEQRMEPPERPLPVPRRGEVPRKADADEATPAVESSKAFHFKLGAWGLAEVLTPSFAAGVETAFEWRGLQAGARLALGRALSVGLTVEYLFATGRLRPALGLRGWYFAPGGTRETGFVGGGPLVGFEWLIVKGLYLSADGAVEFYAVGAPYRSLGVVATVGMGWAF